MPRLAPNSRRAAGLFAIEFIILLGLLIGAVMLDNHLIHHGGSALSVTALILALCTACSLAIIQLRGSTRIACAILSIPFVVYIGMLSFLLAGAGM